MSETRVAVLTPPGKSALATLGLWGGDAWSIVRGLFSPRSGKPLPETPTPGRFWLGRLGQTALARTSPVLEGGVEGRIVHATVEDQLCTPDLGLEPV